jgi:hypothetical protein
VEGIVRVSGASRRLAGPTDLAGLLPDDVAKRVRREFEEATGKSQSEAPYYPHLSRPALIIYALENTLGPAKSANAFLVALKVAVPGDSTDVKNSDGDVEWVINKVASEQWLTEFRGLGDPDLDD